MVRGKSFTDARTRVANRKVDIEAASRIVLVTFAPLFDAYTMFKAKEYVPLRFRAREALSGIPILPRDISFSLRHGKGASMKLPMSALQKGVFQVPFTPERPGQYWVTAVIHGAAVPAVRLGVLGLAEDPDSRHPGAATALSRRLTRS